MKRKRAFYSALALLLVGTSATGLLFSGTDSIALQNPLLRNYFRQLYLDSSSFTFVNRTDPHSAEAQFFERQIDLLAADFLKRLAAKLRALRIHFYEARKSRGEMLTSAPDAGRRVMLQNQLKHSLKSLAQEANDLRKTLSLILVGLDHKADRKPLTKNWGDNADFEKELEFVGEQLARAGQEINDYFLVPKHTVRVEHLKGENVIIYLNRVRQMAKKLSEQI